MRALTPSRQVRGFYDEFDDVFERFLGTELGRRAPNGTPFLPAIESFLKDDKLVVRADLPGIDPKKVDIHVEADLLTIRGERESAREDANRGYREVTYGRFERTVQLPSGIDPDSVKAAYKDGVLEVSMDTPKSMVAKKVDIAVH